MCIFAARDKSDLMALISTIRKHSGLAVGITTIGLILFLIGGDMIQLGAILSGKNRTDVGEIAGQKITLQTYQAQVEQLRRRLPTNAGVQETFVRGHAWHQLITQITYQKACDALGLTISEDELVDMVQGDHICPELQAAFQHHDTKQFDKQQLISYLQQLAQMPEAQQAQWRQFESELAALRQREKLTQLMVKSVCITDLEGKVQQDATQATRHIKCLYIPYYTRPNEEGKATDTVLKAYLAAHKNAYQVKESRGIQYVIFPITPTKEDEHAFQAELQVLKKSFSQAKDDRAFAKINTDGNPARSYIHLTAQQLPNALATQTSTLKKGMVIGPVPEGNVHKLYKVVAINPQEAKQYEIAVIEKQLVPGDLTRDQLFRKADYCASTVKNVTQLADYAAQEALQLHKAQIGKNDVQVGTLAQARELVRWLYNDAAVGHVSPVFELDSEYVVAVMTQHVPPGTAPLVQVRDEIALKVSNKHKADAIMAELQQLSGATLEEKAAQYGNGAKLLEVKNLCFEDDILSSAGMARQAVGTAFALQPGEQATVADDNGVLVVEVVAKNMVAAPEELATSQKSFRHLVTIRQPYDVLQALETLAQIKDNRHKFY
jgi:peptidyl-prolyl cis-trans isomerase D